MTLVPALRWLALVAVVSFTVGCTRMPTSSGEAVTPATERVFATILGVEPQSRVIMLDRADFLTGAAAQRAAEADGVAEPGDPVPNDYFVRNPDVRVERLVLDPNVRIRGATPVTHLAERPSCQPCADYPVTLDQFFAAWEAGGRGVQGKYWLTVRAGRVVAVQEQYLP